MQNDNKSSSVFDAGGLGNSNKQPGTVSVFCSLFKPYQKPEAAAQDQTEETGTIMCVHIFSRKECIYFRDFCDWMRVCRL